MRNTRYDILFEPVKIGPVTAPNRFYQVPHCTGMGYRRPQTLAGMRAMKAEGGWGVVNTEYCSFDATSDDEPFPHASMWDDADVASLGLVAEAVHAHGSLAGCELWHGGAASANLYSRQVPLGVTSRPAGVLDPVQTRAMDKKDIRELRRRHTDAARRARSAGFDVVYIYACHGYLLNQFLDPSNQRSDEYGGSVENRVRLIRELLEEAKEAIGDRCAVAIRFSAGTLGANGRPTSDEPRAMIELIGDLPDLWDLTVDDYEHEMGTSRFVKEAGLEHSMSWVKEITGKPVVSVGRLTSPDTMVRLVKQGVVDLIGAARPSIADPFLPQKIDEGRDDEIRECIGCNICYTGDQQHVPIRCTQNPTMGEEWRKGWHPERIPQKGSDSRILIVGGGPTGLEAAVALGRRGYDVTLAEARKELGGRVSLESTLPGLAEWIRVRDWRVGQINRLPNVEVFMDSELDEEQIREFGADHVLLATGARWRKNGLGRWHESEPIEGWELPHVFTPDEIMAGALPKSPVVVFDDDHYYMGGVIAEKMIQEGLEVTLVTPASLASAWTENTDEQETIQAHLMEIGVTIQANTALDYIEEESIGLVDTYSEEEREIPANGVVIVTSREPLNALKSELGENVVCTGDCNAPATIAHAVYAGHRYARELDGPPPGDVPFKREHAVAPSYRSEHDERNAAK
ncbi:MAG: NADH:flavin oxidoreductase [Deltaproteobacteria bacterium]|nr:NADH:flavin oxidoreductase [Deltaproteobacteria bacterium]